MIIDARTDTQINKGQEVVVDFGDAELHGVAQHWAGEDEVVTVDLEAVVKPKPGGDAGQNRP